MDNGKSRLKEIELALNKAEHHLAEITQKIDKLKDQLSLVTSNKQYDALTQEIEYLKEAMNEAELEDLELEEEKEILQNDVQEKEENLEDSVEKYHRLIFLNKYIEKKFKVKSKNISKKNFENIQNSLSKN